MDKNVYVQTQNSNKSSIKTNNNPAVFVIICRCSENEQGKMAIYNSLFLSGPQSCRKKHTNRKAIGYCFKFFTFVVGDSHIRNEPRDWVTSFIPIPLHLLAQYNTSHAFSPEHNLITLQIHSY